MKTLLSIVSAGTGTGAFAAWIFAIWSEQQTEWMLTAALLTLTAWVTGMLASETD